MKTLSIGSLAGWMSKILKSERYSCRARLSSKHSLGEYVSSLVDFIMQYQFPKSLSDFFVFQWKPTCAGKQPDEVFILFLMFFFLFFSNYTVPKLTYLFSPKAHVLGTERTMCLSHKQILKIYIYI